MPPQRKKEEDQGIQGCPEYMLTYGDMVTLLLCFFVLLLSMSSMEKEKVRMVLSAFKSALGVFEQGPSLEKEDLMTMGVGVERLPEGLPGLMTGREAKLGRLRKALGDKVRMVLAGEISRGAVRLRHDERGVVIQLTDKTLFDSGSAVIREDAKPILSRVATLLKSIPNQIRIEGHTDNRPIRTARYPSNWELSVARATNVLRYLEEVHGISPGRLSASGYGEWRPLRPNTTEGNRALNRRVDIIVLREEVAALEPAID